MSAFRAHSFRSKITVVLALLLAWALASPISVCASDKKKTTPRLPQRTSRRKSWIFPRSTFPNWSGRSRLPFREYATPPTSQV
jgi:hypothetical protein